MNRMCLGLFASGVFFLATACIPSSESTPRPQPTTESSHPVSPVVGHTPEPGVAPSSTTGPVHHGEHHHQAAEAETTVAADHPPAPTDAQTAHEPDAALQLFEQRILPIFQSAKPSSCAECHLSGVDLKDYIRASQAETFASLVAAGLIDVKHPDDSKLLRFIQRKPEQPSLLSTKVREEEFAAFQAWIRAAAVDPQLAAAPTKAAAIGPDLPLEVIRHARRDRVLASFVENVWVEVGRCAACHSPDRNQDQVKKHGPQVSWIKLRDPAATLNHMLENDLLDTDDPAQSLLLRKPTLQVDHGGGQKMVIGDRTYKQFRRFIDDYAATVQGKYQQKSELPPANEEVSLVTEIWFKLERVPAKYDKLLLQVDLYRATETGWSEHRVATSDRPVFGQGGLWQHSLSLTARRGTPWAKEIAAGKLPPGRYLVKLFVDQQHKLEKDFRAELNDDDLVGQVEVESQWPAGYGQMTVATFRSK